MSSSDFSEIALSRERTRPERLFRAAVTAFASLTRPSRRQTAQLEDLTLSLYDEVSADARRYVAAVLSELDIAPAALVRRLANEDLSIAAPVLLRSKALSDVDLIGLIGRHGISHARVIARREGLHPAIRRLAQALVRRAALEEGRTRDEAAPPDGPRPAAEDQGTGKVAKEVPMTMPSSEAAGAGRDSARPPVMEAAESVREKLRALMEPSDPVARRAPQPPPRRIAPYEKLCAAAFTGVPSFFHTALADLVGIGMPEARAIATSSDQTDLRAALKSLGLTAEQAFVIVAALVPGRFGHAEAVRLFLEKYRLLHPEAAADRVRGWKEAALVAAIAAPPLARSEPDLAAANSAGSPLHYRRAVRA